MLKLKTLDAFFKIQDCFLFEDGTKISYDKKNHHLEVSVVDKITFRVGESSVKITKGGIKLNAKRIDLN